MKKILFVKHANSSFVLSDQRTLEKQYKVVPFLINQRKSGIHFAWRMMNLFFFLLFNARGSAAMVTWFGDYHAAVMVFMGRLLRTRVIIFAGGQEAVCYPELGKGVYLKKWRGRFVRYALRNATLIIPNHDSLIYHENRYYSSEGKKDGIQFHVPGITTPMHVIPNGIDTSKYYRDPKIEKDTGNILTVGTMGSTADFLNKGFDLFTELARRNPHLKFTMIGVRREFSHWIENQYRISRIPNLEVIYSFCPDETLFMAYNRAKVFVQASITEGMPNTLNEAMLCACIPVGSNVNGIPDAIGETGVIVPVRTIECLEDAVYKALQLDTGNDARQRVLENFTLAIREKRVLQLFEQQI